MTAARLEITLKLIGVDDVSVVNDADSEGIIDQKRLNVDQIASPHGAVARMPDRNVPS